MMHLYAHSAIRFLLLCYFNVAKVASDISLVRTYGCAGSAHLGQP